MQVTPGTTDYYTCTDRSAFLGVAFTKQGLLNMMLIICRGQSHENIMQRDADTVIRFSGSTS